MFTDRHKAGEQLARKLAHYRHTNAVVYALPRGGVQVGLPIAKALRLPLDVVITRKIGHLLNSEFAVAAVTEHGDVVRSETGDCGLDASWFETERLAQQAEIRRRRSVYKSDVSSIAATDKIAILVDDGIATGLSIKAAILDIKKQRPAKLVLAVPVAPHDTLAELSSLVDEVAVLKDEPAFRGAVGAYYTNFPELSDAEVVRALAQAQLNSRLGDVHGRVTSTNRHRHNVHK